ncbi:hypothetical protein D3C86_2016580 [compost metagenome]
MFAGLVEGVGFTDDASVEDGHLVRANDQVGGMAVCQCPGLGLGQAFYQFDGGLARLVAFIDIRGAADER